MSAGFLCIDVLLFHVESVEEDRKNNNQNKLDHKDPSRKEQYEVNGKEMYLLMV